MAILKIKDADGNFISVPTITGMPKEIYIGVDEPTDESAWIWVDTSENNTPTFSVKDIRDNSVKVYSFERGMTFGEWENSEYNTDSLVIEKVYREGDYRWVVGIVFSTEDGAMSLMQYTLVLDDNSVDVAKQVIIEEKEYVTQVVAYMYGSN